MKKAKAAPAPRKAPPTMLEKAQKLPLAMFHTLKGPVVGHAKPGGTRAVRIWAPAVLSMPTPANVLYLPVTFCEEFIDLQYGLVWAMSPVPEIVAKGYEGFFKNFAEGNYRMQPLVMNAGTPGEEHTQALTPQNGGLYNGESDDGEDNDNVVDLLNATHDDVIEHDDEETEDDDEDGQNVA